MRTTLKYLRSQYAHFMAESRTHFLNRNMRESQIAYNMAEVYRMDILDWRTDTKKSSSRSK